MTLELIDNRYEIISELGEGGMATVYLAKDVRLGREVALKILHPHISKNEELCKRFHQEAAIAAKLEHPNIVQIFDYGTSSNGKTYIVSEVIRGKDFHKMQVERLKTLKKPFPPIFCAMVCAEVLKALCLAHQQNFIHRDVKPDNILISEEGIVKLTDFGIAKDPDSSMTIAGNFLGSPVYSSPEQVQGDPLDFAADLFSMGIILYEGITGQLPFIGKTPSEVMMRIVQGKYHPPEKYIKNIPLEINDIIKKALTTDKSKRFSNTKEMLLSLEQYLHLFNINIYQEAISLYLKDKNAFKETYHKKNQTEEIPSFQIETVQESSPQRNTEQKNSLGRNTQKIITNHPQIRKTTLENKNYLNERKTQGQKKYSSQNSSYSFFPWILATAFLFVLIAAGIRFDLIQKIQNWARSPFIPVTHPDLTLIPKTQEIPPPLPTEIPQTLEAIMEVSSSPIIASSEPSPSSTPLPIIKNTPKMEGSKSSVKETPKETAIPKETPTTNLGRLTFSILPSPDFVYVNGKVYNLNGKMQYDISLAPGKYNIQIPSIKIQTTKYQGETFQVLLNSGETIQRGLIRLIPMRILKINIAGKDITFTINNHPFSLKNRNEFELPEGRYVIEAKSSSGKSFKKLLILKDEDYAINTSLE